MLDPARRPALDDIVERLPNSCENSFYAATEVGPDGSIYTGTFRGVSSYLPQTDEVAAGADPEAAADSDTDDGNDRSSDVWPWLALGVIVAVAVTGIVSLSRRT